MWGLISDNCCSHQYGAHSKVHSSIKNTGSDKPYQHSLHDSEGGQMAASHTGPHMFDQGTGSRYDVTKEGDA
jgi:hypothetical protein